MEQTTFTLGYSMDFDDLYTNKEAFLLQVTEDKIIIYYPCNGVTSVIGFSYDQWSHLGAAVDEMKREAKQDVDARTRGELKKPFFSEINFKDFPK